MTCRPPAPGCASWHTRSATPCAPHRDRRLATNRTTEQMVRDRGMDDTAALPRGSLAARMAQAQAQRLREQAQAQRLREMERQVPEADELPQPPNDADGGPQSADVVVPGTPDASPGASGAVPGSVPDDADADEFAALRRAFDLRRARAPREVRWGRWAPDAWRRTSAEPDDAPDDAVDTGSDATVTATPGPTPADELRRARTEIAQLHAQAQRAQEELARIRRRSERDREDLGHAAKSEAIVPMLPIVDDLERALAQV